MSAVAERTPALARTDAPVVIDRRLLASVTLGTALLAVGFLGLDLADVRVPQTVQLIPFAVSLVLFGLPHGALDHLVPARLDPRIDRMRSILLVVGLYALLGGVTAAIWFAAPVLGFTLFVLVTWFHWGQGDLWVERALRGARLLRLDGVLTTLARGALPMLLPLATHPSDYATVLRSTTGPLGARGADALAPLTTIGARWAIAAVVVALVAAHLLVRIRAGGRAAPAAIECAVLLVFFAAVPPVLAVGLYFTFWHAVRHIVRLELLDPRSAPGLRGGRLLAPFGRFMLDAAPMTAAAIVLLVGLALVVRTADLGTYLLLIAVLTTPHAAVVAWMDRRRARRLRSAA